MKRSDLIYALISTLASYVLIYYSLYVIKNNVGLVGNSLVILFMLWLLVLTHPLVRNSNAFKKIFKKK